jgi:hypothetical protein
MLTESSEKKLSASAIDPIKLRSIVPLRRPKRPKRVDVPSVEEITGLSEDTLKRRYARYIRKLSDRRCGMQLGDAIEIANGK